MKVKLNTDICPIITPDTYGTGFQYEIADDMWEDFKKNVMCKYASQYIKETIRDSKTFGSCPVTVEMELHSPQFYNYGTDWIDFIIDLNEGAVDQIEAWVNDKDSDFYSYIKKFGSHSGFVSFYPVTYEDCQKAISDVTSDKFDLLVAETIMYDLKNEDLDKVQDDFIMDVWDYAAGNGYEVDEEDMEESKILESEDQSAYYEVVYGYQMAIVKTDRPTTDYGAVVDILIDGLEDEGVGEPYLLPLDKAEEELNEDEYVIGGNHSLALVHNGNFRIEPIPEHAAKRYEKDNHITIYSEGKKMRRSKMLKEDSIQKFPDFINKKLDGVTVELTDLDNTEDNFILKLSGDQAKMDAAKQKIKDFMSDLYGGYKLVKQDKDEMAYSANAKATFKFNTLENKEDAMKRNVNAIVNNILDGKSILESIMEGAGRLVSVKIVDEPYGKGIEIKDSNGAIYKYVVDVNDPKYYTPEKVLHAVQGLARRYNNDMGKIYNFLKQHTVDYYDKDVSNRAGLDKCEIVAEPNGEGLKVTLDNGQVYRYTVDTEDPKYNTLELLKNGAEGMWRHGASIDGIIQFLDAHALLYAHEGKELRALRKELASYMLENKDAKYTLGWVK